jgi:hypothetical protein
MVNPHGSTRTRPAELALGGSKRGMGPLRVTGTAGTPVEEPPETNAATRDKKPRLGHLRHTTSRGKGPGVGPVLGPRHEELADRVELRAQHVRPRVCITTAFPRRS